MALVKQHNYIQQEPVDNSGCAHPGCNRKGSIAFTTHAGPETKWFCSAHAFKDDLQYLSDKKRNAAKAKAFGNFSKQFGMAA
jgi:hypothetical protein